MGRRKTRYCVVCGVVLDSASRKIVCSDECRKARNVQLVKASRARRPIKPSGRHSAMTDNGEFYRKLVTTSAERNARIIEKYGVRF